MQDKYNSLLAKYRQLLIGYEKLRKQQKRQFSQKICRFGLILIVGVIAANFILLWFGREPMTDVTTISITVFGRLRNRRLFRSVRLPELFEKQT